VASTNARILIPDSWSLTTPHGSRRERAAVARLLRGDEGEGFFKVGLKEQEAALVAAVVGVQSLDAFGRCCS
jgi:hypothetical protein